MTSLGKCELKSGKDYLPLCSQVDVSVPCERGVLRVGVFFDGTGNDMGNAEVLSNVAKLARVYRIDREAREVRWLYVKGVGTAKLDALGAAFGRGGHERIHGALYCLQQLIEEYHESQEAYPTKVLLDVFGFSRGAALARYFVNVIKQGFFELDAEYQRIPKDAYRVGFLGIFDTVGAFGMPGNDRDPGYTFHIAPHWLEAGGLHLVAEDEHRKNFALHSVLPGQDMEHPRDLADGCLREVVLPGAHADVGGGYGKKQSQGQSNNDLERVGLQFMRTEAEKRQVPLSLKNAPRDEEDEESAFWTYPAELAEDHPNLMKLYQKHPGLRGFHRRWRVFGIAEEDFTREVQRRELELAGPDRKNFRSRELELLRTRQKQEEISAKRSEVEDQMRSCFSHRREYAEFMRVSKSFHATWVHKSHAPHNRTIGMAADLHGLEGRRKVYFGQPVRMHGAKGFKSSAPRAFKGGAWTDLECIEVHSL